jgi:outer membrane protein TolC
LFFTSCGLALLLSLCVEARIDGPFPGIELGEITIPGIQLEVINEALSGPMHEKAVMAYANAASRYRVALAALRPQLRASVQAGAASPFGDKIDAGVAAGPSITLSVPTGQGRTEISLGAGVRTGYAQPIGAQASFSVKMPLLSGPDNRRKTAEHELAVAQETYLADQRQLIVRAMQAYDDFVQAEQDFRLAAELLELAKQEYGLALEREERGSISAAELFRLRSSLNASLDAEAQARRRWTESREALRELTTRDLPEFTDSTEPIRLRVDLPETPSTPEGWVALALSRRTDLKNARQAVSLAEEALMTARLQAKREVSFTAGAQWPHETEETSTDFRTRVHAGVEASFFLWDGARSEEVVAAELRLAAAKKALEDLERAIERSVHAALYDIAESERALRQAREQLEQDKLLLTVAQERFESGLGLQQDVIARRLAIVQQSNRIHALEARLARQCVLLWHAVGADIPEIQINIPWDSEDHCPGCENTGA